MGASAGWYSYLKPATGSPVHIRYAGCPEPDGRFPFGFRSISIKKNNKTTIFGFPSHGSKTNRLQGSLAWIKNRPFSRFLGMDQKWTVFGVPWHGSKIDRLWGSLAWIKNRPSSGFLGMDQKLQFYMILRMVLERNVKNCTKRVGNS